MAAYRFTQRYRSSYGQGDEGDQVDLSELDAANINRDSPGTLKAVKPKTDKADDDSDDKADDDSDDTAKRAVEKAPANRQVTAAKNRGQKAGEQ